MRRITRGVNEGLVINNKFHVTILDIFDDHVRVAISAPSEIPSYWERTLYWEPAEEEFELQLQ